MSGAMSDNKEEEGELVACKTVSSVMSADYRKLPDPNRCVMSCGSGCLGLSVQKSLKSKSMDYDIMLGFAKIRS
jgi:hypothetical protein